MRISNSAKDTYNQCSEKYRLHYQEKLRSVFLDSPLFTGGAADEAFGRILLEKKKELTEEEKELMKYTEFDIFDQHFTTTEHNREQVFIPTYKYTRFSRSDYDFELLNEEDGMSIADQANKLELAVESLEDVQSFMEECIDRIKAKQILEEPVQILYNYITWCSLRRKIHFLLGKYRETVLPQIEEVYSIQEKVTLEDNGHELIGYIDFVASFTDEPGKVYIVDNKLYSRAFPKDAVLTSEQLATYCEYKGIDDAAYVVVEKKLRKREPRERITAIKGQPTEETYEKTFQDYSDIIDLIEEGNFEKLEDKKSCFFFGKPCPYIDVCWNGKVDNFLVKLED